MVFRKRKELQVYLDFIQKHCLHNENVSQMNM